jgi:hypothetical protein
MFVADWNIRQAEIKKGMDREEVIKLVGNPLSKWNDTLANGSPSVDFHYTNDGGIKKKKLKYSLITDAAWFRSYVIFNEEGKVVELNYGWSYD